MDAALLTLAVMLTTFGRLLQLLADWKRHGVGGFLYRYLLLVALGNVLFAGVLLHLGAPMAAGLAVCAAGLHGWLMSRKFEAWSKTYLRRLHRKGRGR